MEDNKEKELKEQIYLQMYTIVKLGLKTDFSERERGTARSSICWFSTQMPGQPTARSFIYVSTWVHLLLFPGR